MSREKIKKEIKKYLLKEAQRTLDESDSTAAFCLCQRWILKDAIALLKEQEAIIEQYRRADGFLDAHGWKWEGR